MSKTAQVFTGKEVKELLEKAVDGIYISEMMNKSDIMTVFGNFCTDEKGLDIQIGKYATANIPISEEKAYINYATEGETDNDKWNSSTYFDYCFELSDFEGCRVSFNVTEKPMLTMEQFEELIATNKYGIFRAESSECGTPIIVMNRCRVDIREEEITLSSGACEVILHKNNIKGIYNESVANGTMYYRIEFNNSMPELVIELENNNRALG